MRPYTICHMMASIDGCISPGKGRRTEEWKNLIKGYNHYYKVEKGFKADAWMCGRVTMEEYASGKNTFLPRVNRAKVNDTKYLAEPDFKGQYAIVVDTQGRLRWKSNLIFDTDHLIIIVTEQTPKKFLTYLRDRKVSYIIGGREHVRFKKVLEVLKKNFSVRKLLIEGGGKLNGSLLQEGLIDEISLIVIPLIIGGSDAPTLFNREPLRNTDSPSKFRLTHVRKLDNNLIWLRYKKL